MYHKTFPNKKRSCC